MPCASLFTGLADLNSWVSLSPGARAGFAQAKGGNTKGMVEPEMEGVCKWDMRQEGRAGFAQTKDRNTKAIMQLQVADTNIPDNMSGPDS